MLLHRICNRPSHLDICLDFLVRIYLRLYEVKCLFCEGLGQADNAIDISNQDITWVYYCILVFAIQSHRCVDLSQSV